MSDDRIIEAAEYGLKFAGEKLGVFHYGADLAAVAKIVVPHVLSAAEGAGATVAAERYERDVAKLRERSLRFEKYWASEQTRASQQLQRVQEALTELDDRELAEYLAGKIGVLLHFEDEAAA